SAAAPLRRSLLQSGFLDVLTSAPDGAAVRRVVIEQRLSQRVLDGLQNAMQQLTATTLNAPPPVAAPELAEQAGAGAPAVSNAQQEVVASAVRLGQAMGYRAVVLLAVVPTKSTTENAAAPASAATYAMMIVDSDRATSDFMVFDQEGAGTLDQHEAAASTGAALLLKKLTLWPEVTPAQRMQRATDYLREARAALDGGAREAAIDLLNQALSLDPGRAEAQVLLGDVLQPTDPVAAAVAYRRALETNVVDPGEMWEKMAVSYAASRDWPRTLDAGRRSLALRRDSAVLRQAMATAQFGRADLFRRADRAESAEEAETDAYRHLDRARELAPNDPGISRLLAAQLVNQKRYREAVEALDRLMPQVTPDIDLQTLYATALTERGARDADAFQAWARAWQMAGTQQAPMNALRYRRIAEGFDQHAADLARQGAQQASGVAVGTLPRENALLQLQKLAEGMQLAEVAIKILQPPAASYEATHASRIFAADLMNQAINAHRVYVETGDEIYRSRGNELHRQAINQLNAARAGAR
ncbi:MAG TPA: tetratricopeptide repeat protein, partial [Abditibacteriaceae bacterium]